MKKSEMKRQLEEAEDRAHKFYREANELRAQLRHREGEVVSLREQLEKQRTLLDKDNRLFASYDETVMTLRTEIQAMKAAKK